MTRPSCSATGDGAPVRPVTLPMLGRVTILLRLLDEVSYDGSPVAGARPADLLAALALHPPGHRRPAARRRDLARRPARRPGQGAAGPGVAAAHPARCRDAGPRGRWLPARARAGGGRRLGPRPAGDGRGTGPGRRSRAAGPRPGRGGGRPADRCGRRGGGGRAGPSSPCRTGAGRGRSTACGGWPWAGPAATRQRSRCCARCTPTIRTTPRCSRRCYAARPPPSVLRRPWRGTTPIAATSPIGWGSTPTRRCSGSTASCSPPTSRSAAGCCTTPTSCSAATPTWPALRALVRTGRLTTILGPGGLGKTRIAHVLAREATQPRVHFVELVGISAGRGRGLGGRVRPRRAQLGDRPTHPHVRAARRRARPDRPGARRRADPARPRQLRARARRGRVAGGVPAGHHARPARRHHQPVAAGDRGRAGRSRSASSPPHDGAELFRRRARAVRPDAELPDDVVADIVARLDGLPLAVELAAARIRTMSVEEVRRALADRFALLRGRDRTAPARHQTLTSVIGWSWDLLSPTSNGPSPGCRSSTTASPATLPSADARPDGPDLVEALVDQSLLTVSEDGGVVRYRMLETVREFGALRLAEDGGADAARGPPRPAGRWTSSRPGATDVFGARQIEAIDHLWPEEGNLTDILRRRPWPATTARGCRCSPPGRALGDHREPRALLRRSPTGPSGCSSTATRPRSWCRSTRTRSSCSDAHRLPGAGVDRSWWTPWQRLGEPSSPWSRVIYAMFVESDDPERRTEVTGATDDPDRPPPWPPAVGGGAGGERRRGGRAASTSSRRSTLVDEDATTWQVATLHTQMAILDLNADDHATAAEHARAPSRC